MIKSRRAVRTFKEQPVPRALLEEIVQAIALAPPGFTPQKTEVIVVQETSVIRRALPEMIRMYGRLVRAMKHLIGRNMIRRKAEPKNYKTLLRHVVPLMEKPLPELEQGVDDSITRNAQAVILLHANGKGENHETDIHIALTYGFLAVHALGLGASVIDLIPPVIQNSLVLRNLFSIPHDNVVISAMILGFPKYRYQRGIKRELKSVAWI